MKKRSVKAIIWMLILVICLSACNTAAPSESATAPSQNTDSSSVTENQGNPDTTGDTTSDSGNTNTTETQATTASQCKHTYGNWMTTKEATCLDKGEQVRICSKCSYAEVGEIAAAGHTTKAGKCERCGENIGADLAQSIRDVIEIYEVYPYKPNSAGGVDLHISFTNKSDKTIKYIHFSVTPYNAVGDAMRCDIRNYSSFTGYLTGPLEPGYEGYSRHGNFISTEVWGEAWYNYSIKSVELDSVRIEYTDGSTFSLYGDEVKLAFTEYPILQDVEQLGYRTGISHEDDKEQFHFELQLQNKHGLDLATTAMVDIRFVNSNGAIVYNETYRVDPEDFVTKAITDGESKIASILIDDWDVEAGLENGGKLYYHVYSPDGKFDFPEESESSFDLPTIQGADNSYLIVAGQSYSGDFPTLLANNRIFLISGVDYTSESLSNVYNNGTPKVRFDITITATMAAGDINYGLGTDLTGRILDANGNTVDTFEFRCRAHDVGSSSSSTVTTGYLEPSAYTLVFDQIVYDANGLVYNFNADLASYSAYITDQVGTELNVPATYAGMPVTALYTYDSLSEYRKPLQTLTIPATVTKISYEITHNCDRLTSIRVDAGNPVYHSAGNCIIETASGTVVAGCGNSTIPTDGSVKAIGASAFYDCKTLKSIVIPASVTLIDWSAFSGCSALENVTLHDNVTLEMFAFEGCTSLRSLTLPAAMTTVPSGLLKDCISLENVTVHGQITEIGAFAFENCTSLKKITIPASVQSIEIDAFYHSGATQNENGILYVGNWVVGYDGKPYDAVIREGTVGIAGDAFYDCCVMKTATIPDSVIHMGSYAFHLCTELREVSLGSGVKQLTAYVFGSCPKLSSIKHNGTKAAWEAMDKNANWFNNQLTVTHLDGTTECSNIRATSSRIWWTNVGQGQDTWKFNNPYIEGNTLYIRCTTTQFSLPVQWKESTETGKFSGEVSQLEGFYISYPMFGKYTKQNQNAGESQELLLEVPLDQLDDDRPTALYFRLHAYVNGKLSNVCIRFTIEW